ncbi:MAG: SLC13 family permease [Bulleidia sp.]
MNKTKMIHLCTGPLLMILTTLLFQDEFGTHAAEAFGVLLWMVYWWVTRPVNMTVTAILPVLLNALSGMVPMDELIPAFSSSSIILIFSTSLLSAAWEQTGLDKRIALKMLSLIGPSMTSQVTVWFLATTILSSFMPNVAVVALYCPIAIAMLKASGCSDIAECPQATPILLAIAWGAGIGGAGTPLGGAMNITAISYLEKYLSEEFLYYEWMMRSIPYLVIAAAAVLLYLLYISRNCRPINGSKEYFRSLSDSLPPISKAEILCLTLFLTAICGSFLRPLYKNLLPEAEPAYIFLLCGFLLFLIPGANHEELLTWTEAEHKVLWGMMILFGGGIALGSLISLSGAADAIASIVESIPFHGTLSAVLLFSTAAVILSELTNSTVSAAILIPIVLTMSERLGLNPIPYWFATVFALNSEFLLPLSIRAIPVAYGLLPEKMFRSGLPITLLRLAICVLYSFLCIEFWPQFSMLA